MNIHLILRDKFTTPFIEFINKNFDIKEHKFILYGTKDIGECKYENVEQYEWEKFNKYIKESNKVIVHSMFIGDKILLQLLLNINKLKKFTWVVWGGDLHKYIKPQNNLKDRIRSFLFKFTVKQFGVISTLVRDDYYIAQKRLKVKGEYKEAIYINPIKLEYLDSIKANRKEKTSINIQIGNSADPSNQHIEVIDILKKYKDENIKVYVPLSYGNEKYACEVKAYGEEVLGEKFIAIMDFMKPEEYSAFLGDIDIAIFNNNRQQALGNIFALCYLGAKIYIRENTSMWEQLLGFDGYKFKGIEQLKCENYEEFLQYEQKSKKINIEISKTRFDEEYIATVWQEIFSNN